MRCHVTLLGVLLAIVAIEPNGAACQEATPQQKAETAGRQLSKSESVSRLLKVQLQAAQKAHRAAIDTLAVERVGGLLVQVKGDTIARPDLAYIWSVRWLHAQRDLSVTKEDRTAAFVQHHQRMKQLRETVRTLVGDGSGGILQASESPSAEWYLAEAELWLLNEREK